MSLLELMVALAIIALVNFYVIPSYQNYIRRGHRLAACTALYRAAQMIEYRVADPNRIASSKAGHCLSVLTKRRQTQRRYIVYACAPKTG